MNIKRLITNNNLIFLYRHQSSLYRSAFYLSICYAKSSKIKINVYLWENVLIIKKEHLK